MISKNMIAFRGFVTFNLLLIWVAIGFFSYDGEQNIVSLSEVDSLREQYSTTNKNAYCNHIRHLVYSHGFSQGLLSQCGDISSMDFSNFGEDIR